MIDSVIVKEMRDSLKSINDTDLRTMFTSAFPSIIISENSTDAKYSEVLDKLCQYYKYDLPVSIGDVIVMDGEKYVVTCAYTDNSVDLHNCTDNSKKINTGLYMKNLDKVSKLEHIKI